MSINGDGQHQHLYRITLKSGVAVKLLTRTSPLQTYADAVAGGNVAALTLEVADRAGERILLIVLSEIAAIERINKDAYDELLAEKG